MSTSDPTSLSVYRHYKGKYYRLRGTSRHSETLEAFALYDCLYPNDLGRSWVRPKDLFFGTHQSAEGAVPRFDPVQVHWTVEGKITPEMVNQICDLLNSVFDSYSTGDLEQRLDQKTNLLLITANIDGAFVGFKLGYEDVDGVFYSALGAVKEEFQGFGIGRALIHRQHQCLAKRGFGKVRTKTLNRWRRMLMLNIECGFEIVGTETSDKRGIKIVMEKSLPPSHGV